jgi:hypothetical protein
VKEPKFEYGDEWEENRLWFFMKSEHFTVGKHVLKEEYELCPICLDVDEPRKHFTRLPCKHCFHTSCIEKWLLVNNFCPMCKRDFHDHQYFSEYDLNYKDRMKPKLKLFLF